MLHSPLDASTYTYLWTRSIIEELVRSGIDVFFVAPGSRSTPLTVAVAQHPDAQVIVHVDERGTAFAALGYGRATGRPAGWITTSGTAVANGLPAVVEASTDGVPMLCLTADRPPELRGSGANQTIDQVRIFGQYPRHFVDLPPPSDQMPLDAVLSSVDEAIYHARRVPPGPVHVNAGFRKPLEPSDTGESPVVSARIRRWAASGKPFVHRDVSPPVPSEAACDRCVEALQSARSGLIVAGRLDTSADAASVRALAEHLQWPIVPDITSRLRLGPAGDALRVAHVDSVLAGANLPAPDAVIHVGGRAVSKRLRQMIRDAAPSPYIVARPDPARFDPDHCVTHHVETTPSAFCEALIDRRDGGARSDASDVWQRAETAAAKTVAQALDHGKSALKREESDGRPLTEPGIVRRITADLPPDHTLVLASSMPIRDANRYAATSGSAVPVLANRGASGIDGTFATAAGCVVGSGHPATLLIGDLASLHDLSSLALLQQQPVVAVIINNGGGGIFHFLPIADHEDVFEPYFATPHRIDVASAAATFHISYRHPETPAELADAYRDACTRASREGASTILEVQTDRAENRRIHERLDAMCAEAVRSVVM